MQLSSENDSGIVQWTSENDTSFIFSFLRRCPLGRCWPRAGFLLPDDAQQLGGLHLSGFELAAQLGCFLECMGSITVSVGSGQAFSGTLCFGCGLISVFLVRPVGSFGLDLYGRQLGACLVTLGDGSLGCLLLVGQFGAQLLGFLLVTGTCRRTCGG